MARPVKHDLATREALLDAAEQLLAQGGPDAVAVRAVADAIDSSTRAVYAVFGSKAALNEALAARGYGYLADLVEAAPLTDDPAADLVAAGVLGFREFAINRPQLFRITFAQPNEQIFSKPAVKPELQRATAALGLRVQRFLDEPGMQQRPAVDIAFMFHSICQGLAANELSRLPPPIGARFWGSTRGMDPVAAWLTALTAFTRGLAIGDDH